MCVHPNVDGPSRYIYNIIDGEISKRVTIVRLSCPYSKDSDVDLIYFHASSYFVLNHFSIHHELVINTCLQTREEA